MLPFERDILLSMIMGETLRAADTPVEGWSAYIKETASKVSGKYNPNYKVLDG